jgi:glutaminase
MKCFLSLLLVLTFQDSNVWAKENSTAKVTAPTELTKEEINSALNSAHSKYKALTEGKNADYIPALKKVDSELFGIVLVTPDGQVYQVGNVDKEFSIQSISKVFTMAEVLQESGEKAIVDSVGVVATGDKFNSITAIEKNKGHDMNSFVNPGAIATTSMVKGSSPEVIWNKILGIHNDFAGRKLTVLEDVYKSEAATNQRNQAIGKLMNAYEIIKDKPDQATDIYTKQCSIGVNAKDLAIMAATLANGGVNPVTKKKVIDQKHIKGILAVMSTAGLYDTTGKWLFVTGLPAKSGVGGGLIAISPGKFGIAAFSPRLDEAGNSVRAQKAIADITERLKANPYDVKPMQQGRDLASEPEEKEEVK